MTKDCIIWSWHKTFRENKIIHITSPISGSTFFNSESQQGQVKNIIRGTKIIQIMRLCHLRINKSICRGILNDNEISAGLDRRNGKWFQILGIGNIYLIEF